MGLSSYIARMSNLECLIVGLIISIIGVIINLRWDII